MSLIVLKLRMTRRITVCHPILESVIGVEDDIVHGRIRKKRVGDYKIKAH